MGTTSPATYAGPHLLSRHTTRGGEHDKSSTGTATDPAKRPSLDEIPHQHAETLGAEPDLLLLTAAMYVWPRRSRI